MRTAKAEELSQALFLSHQNHEALWGSLTLPEEWDTLMCTSGRPGDPVVRELAGHHQQRAVPSTWEFCQPAVKPLVP